ncbi:hypothetical protein JAAARDRAFT_197064 [Jaapia argillacea MUCL 33604]|uniref:DUF6697 domain-containing protein n=1 Tax=Jaapia argillacea MUCL 33604 TaxID=933084 RepID=A0A067PGE9_9AGAM|nr:hypothetical protein JAAARDRAFT_197064 [Jaapia argillacea MUCL 33604]
MSSLGIPASELITIIQSSHQSIIRLSDLQTWLFQYDVHQQHLVQSINGNSMNAFNAPSSSSNTSASGSRTATGIYSTFAYPAVPSLDPEHSQPTATRFSPSRPHTTILQQHSLTSGTCLAPIGTNSQTPVGSALQHDNITRILAALTNATPFTVDRKPKVEPADIGTLVQPRSSKPHSNTGGMSPFNSAVEDEPLLPSGSLDQSLHVPAKRRRRSSLPTSGNVRLSKKVIFNRIAVPYVPPPPPATKSQRKAARRRDPVAQKLDKKGQGLIPFAIHGDINPKDLDYDFPDVATNRAVGTKRVGPVNLPQPHPDLATTTNERGILFLDSVFNSVTPTRPGQSGTLLSTYLNFFAAPAIHEVMAKGVNSQGAKSSLYIGYHEIHQVDDLTPWEFTSLSTEASNYLQSPGPTALMA